MSEELYTRQHAMLDAMTTRFAPEDEVLIRVRDRAREAGLPDIQISPLQGKFLQFLMTISGVRRVLEIGTLTGYSGIWLARALPPEGLLFTLEANAFHAQLARQSFADAGVSDRVMLLEGDALQTMESFPSGTSFDLIFIDADKARYPDYLERALLLSHPGSLIIADNCLPGSIMRYPEPGSDEAVVAYTERVAAMPELLALGLPMSQNYTDGFSLAVVRRRKETD